MPLGAGQISVQRKVAPPSTPQNRKLISDLEECAESGNIGHNDSVLFNATLMGADEDKLRSVFVGDPVERNGKIHYKVQAFDDEGSFEI